MSMPIPRAGEPLMVEAFHLPPPGAGTPSALSAPAMARALCPATKSAQMRRMTAA
nr:hypothetical protein [Sphingomonas hengshuiensis]